nr:MAG: ORF2b [Polycipiviridae sp.]UCS96426.1 MAG: ORF2b [Polycipiviridae sp.]
MQLVLQPNGLTIQFTNLLRWLEFLGMIKQLIGTLILRVFSRSHHLLLMILIHIGHLVTQLNKDLSHCGAPLRKITRTASDIRRQRSRRRKPLLPLQSTPQLLQNWLPQLQGKPHQLHQSL